MSAQPKVRMTPEEYLAFERASDTRHEFWDGVIYAMAGGRRHVMITGNVQASLHSQLRKRPCEIYSTDMRVRLSNKEDFTYPDIVVACDSPLFDDSKLDTLLNPTIIIEVLSDSTEKYDRGDKFAAYRGLLSLQEYVLISQNRVGVEHFQRQGDQWVLSIYSTSDAVIPLPSIGCTLPIADAYEKVDFEPPVDDGMGEVRER